MLLLRRIFKYTGDDTIARIGNNNTIRENAVIIRATFAGDETVVGSGNFIMPGARFSHDVDQSVTAVLLVTVRRCPVVV